LKQIREERPNLPVLILSMHPEEQYALRLLRAGAAGYMNKESAPEELVNAIRRIAQGKKYVSPAVAELLAEDMGNAIQEVPHAQLSDREFQVLLAIASGMAISQIAMAMALSVKTVSTYRTRILEKMHMKTNAELIHYAIKNGLVE
jgi:DNA-binding NarL/FixJ family response regulator